MDHFSFRRAFLAQLAFVTVLDVRTVGLAVSTAEGWVSSFSPSVITTTLTGLDTKPEGLLLLAGVAIFLYLAGAVVELITRGVVRDYLGKGRRKRAIGQLRHHTIIHRLEEIHAPRNAPGG